MLSLADVQEKAFFLLISEFKEDPSGIMTIEVILFALWSFLRRLREFCAYR